MACPSQTYAGIELDGISWTNWSERFTGPVASYFEPDSLADLVNVVQRASAQGHQLHVTGSRWSFENIAWSPDWMVSLARLTRRLTNVTDSALNSQWAAQQASGADRLFHIEAGAMIADLNDALAAVELAMPTLGGNVGQTVAGALSTSTHGGDPARPPLADAVMAMHLVTVDGRELWVERASQPITDDVALALVLPCPDTQIVRDDDLFNALLVGFGRFGVIYSYVLRVRPAFRLAEWTTTIPRTVLTAALRDGIAGGTFLAPLLTMLPAPPAALGALDLVNPVGLEVVFDTNNLAQCWVKRRWGTSDSTDLNVAGSANLLCQIGAAGVLAAGLSVLGAFVAAPVYGVAVSVKMAELQASLDANPAMTPGEMLARVLAAFWELGLGWAIPKLSGVEFGQQYQASATDGKRGPAPVILAASRADSQQMCFRADSIEPVFDAHATGYIDFLDTALDAAVNRQQAGYISMRWSAASRATLSMHNVPSAHAVAIEITSLRGLPGNPDWFTLLEAAAVSKDGRPHWGQINTLDVATVVALYGSAVQAWRTTLGTVVGSSPTFGNAYTAQRGLEPLPGAKPSVAGIRAGDLVGAAVVPAIGLLLGQHPAPPGHRPGRPKIAVERQQ